MSFEVLTALSIFAFVSSITPGPNNIMLMNSGANFGFKMSIPHMLGVSLGFCLMIILVGLGIVQLLNLYPLSYNIIRFFSIAYLLYLAFKMATSDAGIKSGKGKSKPMTFIQAALFQWVNPKALSMALTAITVYTPTQSIEMTLIVAAVYVVINLPSVSLWVVMGREMKRFLTSPIRMRTFNITMTILLVASLYPVLFP